MKQLFSIAAAALVCADIFSFGACTSASNVPVAQAVDSAALKNLAANNAIDKAIESGDVSNLGDYIATDAVDHSGEHGDVVVLPDSVIAGGDAAARFDCCGLHHYKSGAAYCAAA